MRPESPALIWDAREAAKRAVAAVERRTWNDYSSDWIRRAAVERQIEIIGEALNRLRRVDEATSARVPDLHEIIGTRNVIAHGYDAVNHERLWSLLHDEVPALIQILESLLDELLPPE